MGSAPQNRALLYPRLAGSSRGHGMLRAELAAAKTGVLRKRARAAGADMERVEAAIDEDDKAAVVELIVEAMARGGQAAIPEGVAEKPGATAEPEPEPATREVHNAGPMLVHVAGAAGTSSRVEPQPEPEELQVPDPEPELEPIAELKTESELRSPLQ